MVLTSHPQESQQQQCYISHVLQILDAVEQILADESSALELDDHHVGCVDDASILSLDDDFTVLLWPSFLPSMGECPHAPRLGCWGAPATNTARRNGDNSEDDMGTIVVPPPPKGLA